MKHTRVITAIISQLCLPATMLEDIVNHRTRTTKYNYPVTGIDRDLYSRNFDTISTYTIQTFVKGNLQLECFNNKSAMIEMVQVPAASTFLVTCVKEKESCYKVEFTSSLN